MEVLKGAAGLCIGGAVMKPEARSGDGHVDATARRIAQPLVIVVPASAFAGRLLVQGGGGGAGKSRCRKTVR